MRRNPRVYANYGIGRGNGSQRRWTADEDQLVVIHKDDMRRLKRLLPHRSYRALQARTGKLGLATPQIPWSPADRQRLRRLRRGGLTVRQLTDHFPGRTYRAIEDQLRECRIFVQ